jgi:hypothetical protein
MIIRPPPDLNSQSAADLKARLSKLFQVFGPGLVSIIAGQNQYFYSDGYNDKFKSNYEILNEMAEKCEEGTPEEDW